MMQCLLCCFVFFQAEDGIRDLVRSRGLGDVYKRQVAHDAQGLLERGPEHVEVLVPRLALGALEDLPQACLLYTSDAADERSSVDLGGRRIIKKKNNAAIGRCTRVKSNEQRTRDRVSN